MKSLTINNKTPLPYSTREGLNRLRINFNFCGDQYKKVLITSSTPDEGKSFVCYNLWRMLAESGKKVVLLDGDTEYEEAEFFDAGLDYTFPFRIEGREVSVLISDALGDGKVGWNYDILIDGVSLNELQEQRSMGAGGGYEEDEELFD